MTCPIPQLEFVRSDADDAVVRCPHCGFIARLMSGFSLLAAGFNGIERGDPNDVDLQECSNCNARSRWDNIPNE